MPEFWAHQPLTDNLDSAGEVRIRGQGSVAVLTRLALVRTTAAPLTAPAEWSR